VVTGELAEAVVAVHNGPVHNLGIAQNKVGICPGRENIKPVQKELIETTTELLTVCNSLFDLEVMKVPGCRTTCLHFMKSLLYF
jgi:hypothetical protein